MAEMRASPVKSKTLKRLADIVRMAEDQGQMEFLPFNPMTLFPVSSTTLENLAYGNLPMAIPSQSNIPITKTGRKQEVAELAGLLPMVPPASRGVTQGANYLGDVMTQAVTRNPQATSMRALSEISQMSPVSQMFDPRLAKRVIPETKAVDETGNPIMVYHGTTQAKDLEKAGKFGSWRSAWFTDSPVVAGTYAKGRQEFGTHRGRALYPSYLDMKNPFVVDARGNSWKSVPAVLPNEGGDELYYTTNKLAKFARENGYDGLIVKNVFDPGSGRMPTTDAGDRKLTGTTYVVFDPEKQVKSAASDQDIMEQFLKGK
jgi:hypothetical protein